MYVYVGMYIHILYIHASSEDHLSECIQIPVTSPHISLLLQCEQVLISHLEDGNSLLTGLPVSTLILLCLFSTYQSQRFLKRQVRPYKLDHIPLFQYPPMASNLSPSKGKSWQGLQCPPLTALTPSAMFLASPPDFGHARQVPVPASCHRPLVSQAPPASASVPHLISGSCQ